MKTKVVHSESKDAWNVVGVTFGEKYKIARFPYHAVDGDEILNHRNKDEALKHAEFTSKCFNELYKED